MGHLSSSPEGPFSSLVFFAAPHYPEGRSPAEGRHVLAALSQHSSATDADGRASSLLPPSAAPLPAGIYKMTFETGAYFASRSLETFYPRVEVGRFPGSCAARSNAMGRTGRANPTSPTTDSFQLPVAGRTLSRPTAPQPAQLHDIPR
jgi:hypothetical protein